MNFLDSGHKFSVAAGNSLQQIEFGNRFFFTTLAVGMPVQAMEQAILSGGALFGSGLIFPAIFFRAECVVLLPKDSSGPSPETHLRNNFDFGFVQGLKSSSIHLEYWGQVQANGRSILHIDMPNVFELDTDTSTQPFTQLANLRFKIKNVTQPNSKFHMLQVSSDFFDHPMYTFPHTFGHRLPSNVEVPHFIRSVIFRREFKTIFCFKNKKDGSFTPISSTDWDVNYKHTVNYTNNVANRTVTEGMSHTFPSRGSPSNIDETDRRIMAMAKAGAPLMTPAILQSRLAPGAARTVTRENTNPDFVSSFWT